MEKLMRVAPEKAQPRRTFIEEDLTRYYGVYLGQRWEGAITASGLPPTACYIDISDTCVFLVDEVESTAQRREWRGKVYYRRWFATIQEALAAFTETCLPAFERELRRTLPHVDSAAALGFFRLWAEEDLMRGGRLRCYARPIRHGTCKPAVESRP
jgi:hypothetical protein